MIGVLQRNLWSSEESKTFLLRVIKIVDSMKHNANRIWSSSIQQSFQEATNALNEGLLVCEINDMILFKKPWQSRANNDQQADSTPILDSTSINQPVSKANTGFHHEFPALSTQKRNNDIKKESPSLKSNDAIFRNSTDQLFEDVVESQPVLNESPYVSMGNLMMVPITTIDQNPADSQNIPQNIKNTGKSYTSKPIQPVIKMPSMRKASIFSNASIPDSSDQEKNNNQFSTPSNRIRRASFISKPLVNLSRFSVLPKSNIAEIEECEDAITVTSNIQALDNHDGDIAYKDTNSNNFTIPASLTDTSIKLKLGKSIVPKKVNLVVIPQESEEKRLKRKCA
jgi:hypothetical protein